MQNFWIKELRVTGGGKDAVIEFSDGLNFILGRSQTGKSWIIKSIDYLFGASKRPFNPKTGYTKITGKFITERFGEVTLSRNLDEEFVTLVSDFPNLSGEYQVSYDDTDALFLDDFWLSVIGIDSPIMIPKSLEYAREHLSWTNIAAVFYVDENEVDNEDSIFLRDQMYDSAMVSSLIFLINGDYKEGISKILKPKERAAAKDGAKQTVGFQITALQNEEKIIREKIAQLDGIDIEEESRSTADQIDALQKEAEMLVDQESHIVEELSRNQRELIDCQLELDNNENLLSDYKADLRRMDFIIKGETAIESLSENGKCPVCGNDIEYVEEKFVEGIKAETARIVAQSAIIVSAINSLSVKRDQCEARIAELKTRHEDLKVELKSRKLKIADMTKYLDSLDQRSALNGQLAFVKSKLNEFEEQNIEIDKKRKQPKKYHAKKEFEDLIGDDFNETLKEMAKECNYFGGTPSWIFSDFDIEIDGVPKGEHEGKGHRSVLNSMVGMMFYQYFNSDKTLYHPGFLIIDSPFHGLDEGDARTVESAMTTGFLKYVTEHPGNGQIIIAENLDKMPEFDLSKCNVHVVTYKKRIEPDAVYGFIPDMRDDIPKE